MGGEATPAKTTFRSIFVYKLISYINFFKIRLCDEFGIQNRYPGKKKLKIDKKPAILRFINFYHFEGLVENDNDKL